YVNKQDLFYEQQDPDIKSKFLDYVALRPNPNGLMFVGNAKAYYYRNPVIQYVTPEAANARRQVREVERDLLSIPCDRSWFGRGTKHDVPKEACYVGHYGDCYVWVDPDGLRELSNLTIRLLNFTSISKEGAVLTIPGPRYTPSSGFPSL